MPALWKIKHEVEDAVSDAQMALELYDDDAPAEDQQEVLDTIGATLVSLLGVTLNAIDAAAELGGEFEVHPMLDQAAVATIAANQPALSAHAEKVAAEAIARIKSITERHEQILATRYGEEVS